MGCSFSGHGGSKERGKKRGMKKIVFIYRRNELEIKQESRNLADDWQG
jgi:hypothetical protein